MAWLRRQNKGIQITAAPSGQIWTNNNNSAVLAGDLLICAINTDQTTQSVIDNVNGAWTEIGTVPFNGTELSVWMFQNSQAVALNALTVTVTLNAVGNATVFAYGFDGGDGSINHVGYATGNSTLPSATANNDAVGNLLFWAAGNNATMINSAATGDVVSINDRTHSIVTLATNVGYNQSEAATGARSGGGTYIGATPWSSIIVFFNLAAPATIAATRARAIQRRKVKPIRPVSVARMASPTPTVAPTRTSAIQKRKVRPIRPRPVYALVAPVTPTVKATSIRAILKRILRPILRSRSRVAGIPPIVTTEGCLTLSDGLVTSLFEYDGVVTKLATSDGLVTNLALLDELCR